MKTSKSVLIAGFIMLCTACNMYHSKQVDFNKLSNESEEKITRYFIPRTYVGIDIKECQKTSTETPKALDPAKNDKADQKDAKTASITGSAGSDNCNPGYAIGFTSEDRNEDLAYDLTYNKLLGGFWPTNFLSDKDISVSVNGNQRLSGADSKSTPQVTQVIDTLSQITGKSLELSTKLASTALLSAEEPGLPAASIRINELAKYLLDNLGSEDLGQCSLDIQNDVLNFAATVMRDNKGSYDTKNFPNGKVPRLTKGNIKSYAKILNRWTKSHESEPDSSGVGTAPIIPPEPIHVLVNPCKPIDLDNVNTSIANITANNPGTSIKAFIDKQDIEKKFPLCSKSHSEIDGIIGFDREPIHVFVERSINYCGKQLTMGSWDADLALALTIEPLIKAKLKSRTKDFRYTAYIPSNLTVYQPKHSLVAKSSSNYVFDNGMLTSHKAQSDSSLKGFFDVILAIPKGILGAVGSGKNADSGSATSVGNYSGDGGGAKSGGDGGSGGQGGDSQSANKSKPSETISERVCGDEPNGIAPVCK